LYGEGRLRPRIHARFPLERAGEAIAVLSERGVMGKVLVTVAP
ncbi:MAG: zinc-binding dehydrogenase, partial [Mycobacterium sp.]